MGLCINRENGQCDSHFRQGHGGRGYVFQDRYKSTLIQDEGYLMLCLAYLLNNEITEEFLFPGAPGDLRPIAHG